MPMNDPNEALLSIPGSKKALVHEAWEAEALSQRVVVALVRQALDDLLSEPLDDVREREQEQRDEWRGRLGG